MLWLWVKRTGNPSWLSCRSFDVHHQGGHVGELTCEWSPPPPLLLPSSSSLLPSDICDSFRREKKKEHRRVEGVALTSDCTAQTTCMRTTTWSPLTVVWRERQQQQQPAARIPKKGKKKQHIDKPLSKALNLRLVKKKLAAIRGNTCSPKSKPQNKSAVFSPPPAPHPTQYFTSCLNLSVRPSRRVQTARGEGERILSLTSLLTEAAVSSSHAVFLSSLRLPVTPHLQQRRHLSFLISRVKKCVRFVIRSVFQLLLDCRCWGRVSKRGILFV